ncbi:MAG: transposase [Cyanobacteria bacterium P01_D01_bin.115]
MSKGYPSDLTAAQFAWLASRLPAALPLSQPRTTSLWAIVNAIFYLLCEGCSWRGLPGNFPPWQTVYTSSTNYSYTPKSAFSRGETRCERLRSAYVP